MKLCYMRIRFPHFEYTTEQIFESITKYSNLFEFIKKYSNLLKNIRFYSILFNIDSIESAFILNKKHSKIKNVTNC